MKKILFLAVAFLVSTLTFAQDSTKTESPYTPYIAGGISMTNTDDFATASYPSVELGVMRDNLTVAAVFGRNNLANFDNGLGIDNFWYEGKVAYSFPLGAVSGYGVFGVGAYIGNGNMFIEYGGGISKEFGPVGAFVQVSSWDGVTYLTPGLSYSF